MDNKWKDMETILKEIEKKEKDMQTQKPIGKEEAKSFPEIAKNLLSKGYEFFIQWWKNLIAMAWDGIEEDESIERYSVIRSLAAVRKADVVLFVCDATEGLSEQDVKIAGYVHEEGKPSIILVNKWDLVYRALADRQDTWRQEWRCRLPL